MGIFRRVGDIFSSNLHDMVDQLESPAALLRHSVRELESAISVAMHRAAQVIALEKILLGQLSEHRTELEHFQRQAEQAIARGDDDMARVALRRKLDRDLLTAGLETQLSSVQASTRKMRKQLAVYRLRLSAAKSNLVTLLARQSATEARRRFSASLGGLATTEDSFARFKSLAERIELAEAEAEAFAELADPQQDGAHENEFELQIETDLVRLKDECARRA